jgi:uncharacterized protein
VRRPRRVLRDRLGRPLPDDADPATVVPNVPERTEVSAADAIAEATAYLDADLPFHAHEVLEQRWRCAPVEERDAWRALAQWAAALTHRARGNEEGYRRVSERALALWSAYTGPPLPPTKTLQMPTQNDGN